MHEILSSLHPGTVVLDLGSGRGSFDARHFPFLTVRADLEAPREPSSHFVQCSAAALPFRGRSFHAVILNHSFEHFENLPVCVREIARVLAPGAFLYIAVPDASTFTDRVYRWMARGGGHVNPFSDAAAVPAMITAATGLRHAGTRVLCTSLAFLNRRNADSWPPRKYLLFGRGHEGFLRALTFMLRQLDSWFGWRTSVYGWAFYFGEPLTVDGDAWSNVCVRCGSAHPSAALRQAASVVTRRLLPAVYTCPHCNTRNFFTDDQDLRHLIG